MTTYPVKMSAWQRHDSVTFAALDEHIVVSGSHSWQDDPEGLADWVHIQALARRAAGQRVVIRYWQEHYFSDHDWHAMFTDIAGQPTNPASWWYNYPLRSWPAWPEGVTSYWGRHAARMRANGTAPDRVIRDFEAGHSYWHVRNGTVDGVYHNNRNTYFEGDRRSVQDGGTYPHAHPSPYAAVPEGRMGNTSLTLVGQYIADYNQDAANWKAARLREIGGEAQYTEEQIEVFEEMHILRHGARGADDLLDIPESNYGDARWSHQPPDTSNRPERLPRPDSQLFRTSSPPLYLPVDDSDLFEPGPEHVTARQQANRRRWLRMLHTHDRARSMVNTGDRLVPWLAPPGYGASGSDTWASLSLLPWEIILFRIHLAHLNELGQNHESYGHADYIIWNSKTVNPRAAITDAWVDAYLDGMTIGETIHADPIDWDGDLNTLTTGRITTHYADLYEMDVVYYRRGTPRVKYGEGWPWSSDDPIVISEGESGDAELADLVKAIEINQGMTAGTLGTQEITWEEEPTMGSVTYTVSRHQHAPEVKRKIATGERCGLIFEVDDTLTDLVCEAVVRRRPGAKAIHTYAPDVQAKEGGGHTVTLETEDTADWPEGLLICDVMIDSVETGPARVARMLIDVERSTTP